MKSHLKLIYESEIKASFGTYVIHFWGRKYDVVSDIVKDTRFLREHYRELPGISLMNQVHKDTVIEWPLPENDASIVEADACFSRLPGQGCAVRVADCVPLLFYDMTQPLFGAIHSGWRGFEKNIISRAISISRAQKAHFWVGPHIHKYEVGSDVYSHFSSEHFSLQNAKAILNLASIAESQMVEAGVSREMIAFNNRDTFQDAELFSHRNNKPGRNIGLVFLKTNV